MLWSIFIDSWSDRSRLKSCFGLFWRVIMREVIRFSLLVIFFVLITGCKEDVFKLVVPMVVDCFEVFERDVLFGF